MKDGSDRAPAAHRWWVMRLGRALDAWGAILANVDTELTHAIAVLVAVRAALLGVCLARTLPWSRCSPPLALRRGCVQGPVSFSSSKPRLASCLEYLGLLPTGLEGTHELGTTTLVECLAFNNALSASLALGLAQRRPALAQSSMPSFFTRLLRAPPPVCPTWDSLSQYAWWPAPAWRDVRWANAGPLLP
jgi:hypothetical protein